MASSSPSIHAVAAHAGVSAATVSRVLNGSKPVNAETRQRVEAAVAALGYTVNALGRNLRTARTGALLVLVPNFANPFHGEVLNSIEAEAAQHGHHLVIADAGKLWERGASGLDAMYTRLCDGVISLSPLRLEHDLSLKMPDLPWVGCTQYLPELGLPFVSVDHARAGHDAVQYLINQGHRRIALITSSFERFVSAHQRRAGYEAALRQAGLDVDPGLVFCSTAGDASPASGAQVAATILALREPPTAVFAVTDLLALGALKVFKSRGLRLPQDMAVVGFDDSPFAEYSDPPLSSVAQPTRDLGREAVRLLLAQLGGHAVSSMVLPHRLVLRSSA